MEKWQGKVALVTGASEGIGKAIVDKLVEKGMKVIGCARNLNKLEEIAAKLNKNGPGEMFPRQCDLNYEDQILEMFKFIKDKFGIIHVCVSNAGLAHHASLLSGKTKEWAEMMNINILALCIVNREAISLMKSADVHDGHIINISSMSGHRVTMPFYSATKFTVRGLTEGLRQELRKEESHIRVSSISPGFVQTEFAYRLSRCDKEKTEKLYSEKPCLKAEDVANSLIYILESPLHMEVNDILIRPTDQKL